MEQNTHIPHTDELNTRIDAEGGSPAIRPGNLLITGRPTL